MDNASTNAGGHLDGVSTDSAGQGAFANSVIAGHGLGGGTPVVDRAAPSGIPASGVHTTVGLHSHHLVRVSNMRIVNQ